MNKLTYFKSTCGLFIYCTEIDTTELKALVVYIRLSGVIQ